MKAGRLAALIAGAMLMLPAVGAIVGGSALALGYAFGRTAAGEFELSVPDLDSSASAITATGPVVLTDIGTPYWLANIFDTDVRLTVTPQVAGQPIFVGVGDQGRVADYLQNVARDEIGALHAGSPVYQRIPGTSTATPPTAQPFWTVAASGPASQEVRYPAVGDRQVMVVMNADGSRTSRNPVRPGLISHCGGCQRRRRRPGYADPCRVWPTGLRHGS